MRKDYSIMRILIVLLLSLIFCGVPNPYCVKAISPEEKQFIENIFESRGKEINFSDSSRYDRERAIVYKITDMEKSEKNSIGSMKKADIGISLEDIDNDGNNEILAYIVQYEWCGKGGGYCTFIVLKKNRGEWNKWFDISTYKDIKMLDTSHYGYRDFAFTEEWFDKINSVRKTYIMRFNGKQYIPYAKREFILNKESKKEKMLTYKFNTKTKKWKVIGEQNLKVEK